MTSIHTTTWKSQWMNFQPKPGLCLYAIAHTHWYKVQHRLTAHSHTQERSYYWLSPGDSWSTPPLVQSTTNNNNKQHLILPYKHTIHIHTTLLNPITKNSSPQNNNHSIFTLLWIYIYLIRNSVAIALGNYRSPQRYQPDYLAIGIT